VLELGAVELTFLITNTTYQRSADEMCADRQPPEPDRLYLSADGSYATERQFLRKANFANVCNLPARNVP